MPPACCCRNALQTLLHTDTGLPITGTGDSENYSISNVFNFYNYLRTHPLLIRQKIVTAVPILKNKQVISGFSQQQNLAGTPEDEVASVVDKVTPMERRLFFATAHAHYKNGNPILALEVLSKLPNVVLPEDDYDLDSQTVVSKSESDTCINTGNLSDVSDTSVLNGHDKVQSSGAVDWGQPVAAQPQTADAFDWSTPVASTNQTADSIMDWGEPVSTRFGNDDDELKLDFSSSSDSEDDSDSDDKNKGKPAINGVRDTIPGIVVDRADSVDTVTPVPGSRKPSVGERRHGGQEVDIFAQQYKFIACLKVMMEEMQTLATGFEVDGGQLRYQVCTC